MIRINRVTNTNYIPPRTLGEGLARVKKALGCVGECIKNANGYRLYATEGRTTVYMTTSVLHKTQGIVSDSAQLDHTAYNTFAGTALRIRRSTPCGRENTKPNQLVQLMRAKLYSDAVSDTATGVKSKPLFAVTDFGIINSVEGKPVVAYGVGKHSGSKGIAASVQEISSNEVPKEYTGINAPDGNIVYYLRDTVCDGKRTVKMKMYEAGIDVPILQTEV